MRSRDAIEHIDAIWGMIERRALTESQWEALREAIKALNMQVPKVPVDINGEHGIRSGKCPICLGFVYETYSHCKCGHKIDWEVKK